MEDLAQIILKHDGVIWGEYVWSKFSDHVPSRMNARFVSLNVFTDATCPRSFLIDLKQRFEILKIKNNDITLYDHVSESEILLELLLNNPVSEISFCDGIDFTCNLIDYSRTGYAIRKIPTCIALESSPYDTVVSDIKSKNLKIVTVRTAMQNAPYMIKMGWKMRDLFVTDVYISKGSEIYEKHLKDVNHSDCAICKNQLGNNDDCLRTSCLHVFHLGCIKPWYAKSPTCPLCREQI